MNSNQYNIERMRLELVEHGEHFALRVKGLGNKIPETALLRLERTIASVVFMQNTLRIAWWSAIVRDTNIGCMNDETRKAKADYEEAMLLDRLVYKYRYGLEPF